MPSVICMIQPSWKCKTHILIQRGLDIDLELQTNTTMKWIALMKFLIG
jgi:hypothetical protein